MPDLLPLQLAAHKALTADVRGKLITKTLHSELVCNLSGSKHVSAIVAPVLEKAIQATVIPATAKGPSCSQWLSVLEPT